MDWTLMKGVLESIALLIVLPAAAYYLFRVQRRQLEDQTRRLEDRERELEEKERLIGGLKAEVAAEKEKFRVFACDLVARTQEAWGRFLEEESSAVRSARESGSLALQEQFEGFKSKLAGVQEDLEHFRHTLLGEFQAFCDQRRKALETRGLPLSVYSELMAEMRLVNGEELSRALSSPEAESAPD
ncbi:MAG: hypothetical protein HYY21_03315 [Candidatus Tectomicrobia bacterium]|nr:hypothetical protein [Candidatus Tectomicrobia bacterium]